VLDASALLAYLGNEAGADVVADSIAGGATLSTVNLAEALSTLAARGSDPAAVVTDLTSRGLLDGAITIEPFTTADSIEAPDYGHSPTPPASRSLTAHASPLRTDYQLPSLRPTGPGLTSPLDIDVRPIRNAAVIAARFLHMPR